MPVSSYMQQQPGQQNSSNCKVPSSITKMTGSIYQTHGIQLQSANATGVGNMAVA